MTRLLIQGFTALVLVLTAGVPAFAEKPTRVTGMDDPRTVPTSEGQLKAVAEGPRGATVLRSDSPFVGRIDLTKNGIEPRRYDLLKLELKADARSTLQVSLENYPEPGQLSHWYVFAKSRGAFDWETVYVDLHRPEEIMPAGAYKGLDKDADPTQRGLRLAGFVAETKRATQPPGRRIWLGPVRFVKKAVDLDWDQRQAPYTWEKGQDLVFRYPLTVANRLDRAATARLELLPRQAGQAAGKLSQTEVLLKPGETKTVTATLTLPARVAAEKPALYAERFLARAAVQGVDDSEVTILRSSDPVDLTVTVPFPEAKLRFPLLPRRKDLPDRLTGFVPQQRQTAEKAAEQVRPEDLAPIVGNDVVFSRQKRNDLGFYPWGKGDNSERYLNGLTGAAFLYDFTGDRKYLVKGTALLRAAAEHFPKLRDQWQQQDVIEISNGILAVGTLRLGWATGSMRAPYFFQRHGMFNDFDLLAADMEARERQRILQDFVLPAAIQMRNHNFGLGNQQDVVNYAILYAGLATRNWPLVSFAYDSDYGLLNQIAWDFDDDGLAGEGNYHTPALRPILYATELLHQAGLDLYNERLYLMTHSPGADAIGKPFRDTIVSYLDQHRFAGKDIPLATRKKTDGLHLSSGVTSLRWDRLEVSMNWGTHINRGAPDRATLTINAPEKHPLRQIGGGNYTHSSLGQSIIIVDEGVQNPVPARVTGYDIDGPVQFVQASATEHFPGTTITRTFALVKNHVLVLDRVRSDRERTLDWCLRFAGGAQTHKEIAAGVDLDMEFRKGSFTDKKNDTARGVNFGASLRSDGYFKGATDKTWHEKIGRMVMAGGTPTQVLVFDVQASFSAAQKERGTGVPVLMARRAGVRQADFLVAFSPAIKQIEARPVTRADGKPAEALGVEVTLDDGKTFLALANFEPEGVEVRCRNLKTTRRFATDYAGD